jgi:hypothetical protein
MGGRVAGGGVQRDGGGLKVCVNRDRPHCVVMCPHDGRIHTFELRRVKQGGASILRGFWLRGALVVKALNGGGFVG